MIQKIVCIFLVTALFSCDRRELVNECFPEVTVFSILNTRLPVYQDLNFDGGTTNIYNIQGRNIAIIRNSSSNIIAFDLECPERICDQPLDVTNPPRIICVCNNKEYNYLQGGRLVGEEGCGLLMYTATLINNGSIQISN